MWWNGFVISALGVKDKRIPGGPLPVSVPHHIYPHVHVHRPPNTHTALHSLLSLIRPPPPRIQIVCCDSIWFAYRTRLEHSGSSATDRTSGLLSMSTAPFRYSALSNYSFQLPLILSYPHRELSLNRFRFVYYIFCCHVKEWSFLDLIKIF